MARPSKLDSMSYKELLKLKSEVEAAISARRESEQEQVRRKIFDLAKQSGIDVSDLFGRSTSKKKVAVKFRNPANPSQTWTGRGRQPRWLVEALKKGAKRDSFAV